MKTCKYFSNLFLSEKSLCRKIFLFLSLMITLGYGSCDKKVSSHAPALFTLLSPTETGIDFANNLHYSEEFNMYTFRNFYNGGGVGIGDINNDGLPDIFLCSNQGSNKLYLNKGNFHFEDITEKAGVGSDGVWSTGVSFADVNGDGLLDIYVCKSGDLKSKNRSNQLFINNGNLTFTDRAAEYGLANTGLSTHAIFFDYDNDGDLDCYLLNNSFRSIGNYDLIKDQRKIPDSLGGNKLFRNDGGHFTDVTSQAGIYSSKIGFGLGVTIADVNKDGWPDIYVSNDFFEKDYLYINKKDGTFEESLEKYICELSMNSMGADIADINNDGYPDIFVTDMLPEKEARVKTKTSFETWDKYQSDIANGYYHQFVRNVLQLNRGIFDPHGGTDKEAYFSEIGRFAGVQATDWSWGALIADLDNDGHKDIFVANGIYKDLTDQDYIQFMANPTEVRKMMKEGNGVIKKLIDLLPSHSLPNYAFSNNGDLTFTNKATEWGLDQPGFSNGSAYGDLDNDGALDMVVNNVNMPVFIYRNNSRSLHPDNRYLKVILAGEGKNRFGTGAKVTVYYNHGISYQEEMPTRGFESTVDNRLNFGLGNTKKIDSVVVDWPGGKRSTLKDLKPDQSITIKQAEAKIPDEDSFYKSTASKPAGIKTIFSPGADDFGIDFVHRENEFNDFNRDRLTFQMLSTQGPRMATGDVNGDGLEDFYVCGAKGQSGSLYLQNSKGKFEKSNEALFGKDKECEDVDCLFFDADGDGDLDLFVCSGGNEFSPNSSALISRLYMNDGKGNFTKSAQMLPSAQVFESSSCVSAADYDGDGDMDLFVGVRLKPFAYGIPCKGYILQNNGKGVFTDVTDQVAPELQQAGMITDAKWFDYDKDGKPDLVIVGEYMPVSIFHNEGGRLKNITKEAGLDKTNGWWTRLDIADINGDGYPDLVAGNHGLNSRFKASEAKPVTMYVSDFDESGTIEQLICCYNGNKQYPVALRHDLLGVLPYLKKKYLRYEDYQGQTMQDIFSRDQLNKAIKLNAYELKSCVFMNNSHGGFTKIPLPAEAQFSPIYGLKLKDFDGDGKMDLLTGGNFYQSKPEVGINDGSYGLLLKGDGNGNFKSVSIGESGFFIKGAVRDIKIIKRGKQNLLLIAKNNDSIQVFHGN